MTKIKAIKVVTTVIDEYGKEEELVVFEREAGYGQNISMSLQNGFSVSENAVGHREFKPTGATSFLINYSGG